MGLLDEAIREHLELKRRRGADPSEIERAEREALGPVRRAPAPTQLDDAEGGSALEYEGEEGYENGGPFAEETEYSEDGLYEVVAPVAPGAYEEPPVYEPEPAYEPEPSSHEPAGEPEKHHGDPFDQPTEMHPAPHPAPVSPAPGDHQDYPQHPPAPGAPAGDHTVEYDALSDRDADPASEGDDVLEETPEFLQDTPDHDRLWFEQRPPRDFDFEG